MPIFEYSCADCGGSFEKLQKTATDPKPVCSICGSENVIKELSAFSSAGSSTSDAGCYSGG